MNMLPSLRCLARLAPLLALVLLGVPAHAATPGAPAPPRARLHYTTAKYTFDVHDAHRNADESSMERSVEWDYPVFADTRDPATQALNAWLRRWAVRLLVGDGPLAEQADRLTDRALMAKVAADPDFIVAGVDQVSIQPARALGRYRGFSAYASGIGGVHPIHGVEYLLFDVGSRGQRAVSDLFKPGSEQALSGLHDAHKGSDGNPCAFRGFNWIRAELADIDTLAFEYPYEPGQGVDCDVIAIKSPQVTRLLKSPRSVLPAFDLVEEKPSPSRQVRTAGSPA